MRDLLDENGKRKKKREEKKKRKITYHVIGQKGAKFGHCVTVFFGEAQ